MLRDGLLRASAASSVCKVPWGRVQLRASGPNPVLVETGMLAA